jgi:hypothetical protein
MRRRGRDSLRCTRRWVISSFIVSLALLSGFSLVDDRRHAAIVEDVILDGERVAAYQQAAYLSAYEMSLIQATADNPSGPERQRLLAVDDEMYRATLAIAQVAPDGRDVAEAGTIARRQSNLRQVIIWYLSLLDRGETAKALHTLETVIEPTTSATPTGCCSCATATSSATPRIRRPPGMPRTGWCGPALSRSR